MGDLEGRVDGKLLVEFGTSTIEEVVGEMGHFLFLKKGQRDCWISPECRTTLTFGLAAKVLGRAGIGKIERNAPVIDVVVYRPDGTRPGEQGVDPWEPELGCC
jgi:hypothetical protein